MKEVLPKNLCSRAALVNARLDHREVVLAEALKALESAFAVIGFRVVNAGFDFWAEIIALTGTQLSDEIVNLKRGEQCNF